MDLEAPIYENYYNDDYGLYDDANDAKIVELPNPEFQCQKHGGQWHNGQDNIDEPFPVCDSRYWFNVVSKLVTLSGHRFRVGSLISN